VIPPRTSEEPRPSLSPCVAWAPVEPLRSLLSGGAVSSCRALSEPRRAFRSPLVFFDDDLCPTTAHVRGVKLGGFGSRALHNLMGVVARAPQIQGGSHIGIQRPDPCGFYLSPPLRSGFVGTALVQTRSSPFRVSQLVLHWLSAQCQAGEGAFECGKPALLPLVSGYGGGVLQEHLSVLLCDLQIATPTFIKAQERSGRCTREAEPCVDNDEQREEGEPNSLLSAVTKIATPVYPPDRWSRP